MVANEQCVGDYLSDSECSLDITYEMRYSMVELMEQLIFAYGHEKEAFFLATNLSDRYLAIQAVYERAAPSLIELGIVSILLAIKILHHVNPGLNTLVKTVNDWDILQIERENLLYLEYQVLVALDFDLLFETPTSFLDRFEVLIGGAVFCADISSKGKDDSKDSKQQSKARQCSDFLCVQMFKSGSFLKYRPSQVAAVATIAALLTVQSIQ